MAVAILLAGKAVMAQELQIDAAEIQGQAGTEVLARDAVLTYGDVTLRSARILYDTQAGWIKASDGVSITDGTGNVLETRLLDYFPQLGRAIAEGDVRFTSEQGLSLWAHLVRFEIEDRGVFLEGGGRLQDRHGNEITASAMSYQIEEKRGEATDVVLRGPDTNGVITASSLGISPEKYTLAGASYTTCKIDDPAWVLKADSIEMDGENQVVANGASLRLSGVPVFYVPRMTFNLSKERRSGFLSPKVSFRSGGEVNFEFPYYVNLAPNYDAIVSPRIINERGVLTNVRGRWLFPDTSGTGNVSYIRDNERRSHRWAWQVDNRMTLASDYRFDVVGDWVSDDFFADDFYEGSATAKRHYEKGFELGRETDGVTYGLGMLHHRTIDEADPGVTRPFDSMPFAWATWDNQADGYDLFVEGRYDMFTRGSDDPLEGHRLHTVASAGRTDWLGQSRLDTSAGVAGSAYDHQDAAWAVPFATALFRHPLEGEFDLGDNRYRQMVEPRLMVGVVGKDSFADVPVYDTARTNTNAVDIYNVNSFVGGDRFDDTNLVVYGVETRLWHSVSDREVFSARLAQRYRLENSEVVIDAAETPPKSGPSNLIAEGALHPTGETAVKAKIEWDPTVSKLEQLDLEAQRVQTGGDAFSVRYARNVVEGSDRDEEQAGLRLVKNLSGNWHFASDINYDLNGKEVSEVFSGLSYTSSCRCWSIDFYAEREAVVMGDRTTYFFQINLDGLGGFGSDRLAQVIDDIREPL